MNEGESIELLNKGKLAWNAWASSVLEKKENLQNSGEWIEGDPSNWNSKTREWHADAKVDFSSHAFHTSVDFKDWLFPGDAVFTQANLSSSFRFHGVKIYGEVDFSGVTFPNSCNFENVIFCGKANFEKVNFKDRVSFIGAEFVNEISFEESQFDCEADFREAKFEGKVSFSKAIFSDRAMFVSTKFSDSADFQEAIFSRFVAFMAAEFSKDVFFSRANFENSAFFDESSFGSCAKFSAIRVRGAFSLFKATFSQVPDFTVANFEEAPLFDIVNLEPERFRNNRRQRPEVNHPAHWRALKRLAIQGHDYENEIRFFKGEIIARRGIQDRWMSPRFWAGWLYQLLSDFGWSMLRPFMWLIFSVFLFAGIYASQSVAVSGLSWYEAVPCTYGSSNTRMAALSLSVNNAIPFAGIWASGLLKKSYACLYGVETRKSYLINIFPTDYSPRVPYVVALIGVIQFITSAVLIFLIVLAVRNYFRLK